jgi:hypothetical protein
MNWPVCQRPRVPMALLAGTESAGDAGINPS